MALNFLLFYEWVVVLCVCKTLERFLLCSMLICFLGCSQVYGTIVVGDVVNTEAENTVEKHTVKTTFGALGDVDNIPVYNSDNPKSYMFSGHRVYRGLYKTSSGKLFNADVNGALNILRKSSVVDTSILYGRGDVDTPVRIRVA